jgi:hypothetical protein
MKEFLCKFQEIKIDENGEQQITTLNFKVAELMMKPMRFVSVDDKGNEVVEEIEKDMIVCDGCNEPNPEYVLMDNEYLERTVCEKCRKYYKEFKVVRGDEMCLN